ncbi:MAG TPA: hypothetical protein VK034_27640, partial [Enhygromyxa sp.]|nr:hypothetical protein [Enhygromyxa sp.]
MAELKIHLWWIHPAIFSIPRFQRPNHEQQCERRDCPVASRSIVGDRAAGLAAGGRSVVAGLGVRVTDGLCFAVV